MRALKLEAQPLCELCDRVGRATPAIAVDHIISINAGGDPFPTLDGLQSLCVRCHNAKSRRVDQLGQRHVIKCCDGAGLPLDPLHPFLVR